MDVVGHDDPCVEIKVSIGVIFFKDSSEETRIRFDLKERAAVRGDGGDEEGADFLRCERHSRGVYREYGMKDCSVSNLDFASRG